MFRDSAVSFSAARTALALGIIAFVGFSVVPEGAHAEKLKVNFKDKIHVVQPKPVLQKGRFEIATRMGTSLNDAVNRTINLGVSGNFHLSESFFVGVGFDWADFGGSLGGPTDVYEEALNQGLSTDAPVMNYAAMLEFGWVPFFGKLSALNSTVVFYDFAIVGGVGWVDGESLRVPTSSGTVGGKIGINSRLFLSKWIALNLGVRNTMFSQDVLGGGQAVSSLANVFSVEGGVSFFFPTEFKYTEKIIESDR